SKCFIVDAPSYGSRCSSFLGETGMLVISEEKTFMVMASTAVEKDGWLQAIRLCMRELSTTTSSSVGARGRGFGSSRNQVHVLDEARAQRRRRQHNTCSPPGSSSSSPQSWSVASHSPMAASAPRSVWVAGKNGSHKTSSLRLVEFCLPPWAGVRSTCGCLSHTELTWGRDSLAMGGLGQDQGFGGGGAAGAGVMSGVGLSPNGGGEWVSDRVNRSGGTPQSRSGTTSPRKVAVVISMRPSEPMGLRLRDVHPECGGGVVVIGFERSAAGKRAGVLQGDRITEVNGIYVSRTNDIVWALQQQQQQQQQHPGIGGLRFSGGGRRQVKLTVLRGFPDSEKPWLPRLTLEPSPTATVLTPPSSAVESPASEDDEDDASVPSPVLSAPGLKTFSGRGTSGNNTLGFAGFYSGGGHSTATAVNYRPEEPPPSAATASSTTPRGVPEDIAVNTPVAPSPEAVLSAPGRKTFSGGGGGGGTASLSSKSGKGLGFGFSGADHDEQEPAPTLTQQQRRQRAFLSTTATTVELGKSGGGGGSSSSHALTLAVDNPPSPDETKGDEDSGEWGDSNGSADSTGGGRALKVPAPTQANVNAGGDPAVPFATFRGGGRATPSREEHGPGHGMPSLGLGVGSALAACWGVQVQEANDHDENSRPTEFDLSNSEEVEVEERIVVRKPPPVLVAMSRGTSATSSTVGGAGDYGEYDEGFGDDIRSAAGSSSRSGSGSGSSRDSSLFLAAVSPSRVPPPLVSVASSVSHPPVSMASSVVSGGSFSNPWLSPTPN
ncbi:unnamed protein product, partial [Ectocarpus fasciculatus]